MTRRPAPVPASTYRLQLTADFTLHDAAALVPYLRDLGVDWVYLSPVLAAEPGSTHGYDVVDPTRIDEARGGRDGLEALSTAAHDAGMGVLVDIVPNHMGIATPHANPYWWDVLMYGEASRFAHWFDIDWAAGADDTPPYRPADGWVPAASGKVVQAVLGTPDDLEKLEFRTHEGNRVLAYYDHVFPLAPGSTHEGMSPQEAHAVQNYRLVHWKEEDRSLNYRRFFSIKTLAGVRVEDPRVFEETHTEVLAWFREGLVDGLRIDHIDGLAHPRDYLARLARRTGGYIVAEKILSIGARGERESVPESWLRVGASGTTGYEIVPFIDGALADRTGFFAFEALRQHLVAGGELTEDGDLAGADLAESARHLTRHPTSVTGLFHQIEQSAKTHFAFGPLSGEMLRLAREIKQIGWAHVDAHTREVIGEDPLAGVDEDHLADVFGTICASLPVYRVYAPGPTDRLHALSLLGDQPRTGATGTREVISTDTGPIDISPTEPLSHDGRIVLRAIAHVRSTARSSIVSDRALAYLGAVLTTPGHPVFRRFTQTTGAVTAKGVEDTAFYRYAALTALAEVGGRPAEPLAPAALAQEFERRATGTSFTLNSLTTHDTKRSEDTRARILALAEVPRAFTAFLARVRSAVPIRYVPEAPDVEVSGARALGRNESLERARGAITADASFDILLWQAVVGAWPASPERLRDYALKAARENGLHTTWTEQNTEFEESLVRAVDAVSTDPELRGHLEELDARIREAGVSNGLVAKALHLLAPGVPDVYQGTEFTDRSLVDPDNRRPVDWVARKAALAEVSCGIGDPQHGVGGASADASNGEVPDPATDPDRAKLRLVTRLLHLRAEHRDVFVPEDRYLAPVPEPVGAHGSAWEHCVSFLFGGTVLLIGTRLPIGLTARGGWQDTVVVVPPGSLRELDEEAHLARVLAETDPLADPLTDSLVGDGYSTDSFSPEQFLGPSGSVDNPAASGARGAEPVDEDPDVRWRDVLTGREYRGTRLHLRELLSDLPVAVLERID
ncbi:alpha-amylase family glycosyl hydrolase [Brevibacterium samyangense]|uniref:Malto-oligosyltrehalose synthase n=1 Tax=Brevibacterium samyangense TaxID=366888 RepID=A0ABP5ENP2_9MICO